MKEIFGRNDATYKQVAELAGFIREVHTNLLVNKNEKEQEKDFTKVYEFYQN